VSTKGAHLATKVVNSLWRDASIAKHIARITGALRIL
jgi:hypothetical protein